MSRLIKLQDISISFNTKICFEGFTVDIFDGSKIAILGDNGSGKSSLLKVIKSEINVAEGLNASYVSQVIDEHDSLSGAEKFNKALSEAMAENPDVLLLDEPTNHLDKHNRKSLIRMLNSYPGTVIVATHDMDLIRNFAEIFWHIENNTVHQNNYGYDGFTHEQQVKRIQIEGQLHSLNKDKKATHESLMHEQGRAKNSKKRGEKSIAQRKWPTVVSNAKAGRAQETSGRKKKAIADRRENLAAQLSELRLPEIIIPKFSITPAAVHNKNHLNITGGSIGYDRPLIENINLSLSGNQRIAITGKNGSGKTTLLKAILDEKYRHAGNWYVTDFKNIGYLDQHYKNIDPEKTVLENLSAPEKNHAELRDHLNDFLFRKNEQVNQKASKLSGGELARLSLAQIALQTPDVLILDEVTNNLDLKTRNHVVSVLQNFPGAMLIISHDEDFLNHLGIDEFCDIIKA